ncbi:MAG: hypothetical protein E7313_03700 [Clostridiales bacterium]|nr:hypothetical protein [Clostridiales bacterium]
MKNRVIWLSVLIMFGTFSVIILNNYNNILDVKSVNATAQLSNKKICWGIKRAENHEQPDVGTQNKSVLEKYNGLCMGNSNSKKVYLTFDAGYEAGYMDKILETLNQNNVKACFFITGHYLNTQPELVQKMIDEGHIVGNHMPNYLMFGIKIL